MFKRLLPLVVLLTTALSPARDKAETWHEVRSPHFVVVSNANDKQARRVAEQFEKMRLVFQRLLPQRNIDPASPIVVLAIRDQKDFRALEPAAYLAKGSLQLGGLFLRVPDKNYVLMRLDVEGGHPYSVVYHEYTHLLLSKIDHLPLWLNEGLAEFYQNTEIRDKEVNLGIPSPEDLQLLRQYPLLPFPVLFKVDQSSPYYHEETKGSIFYGESWALTHYLETKDFKEKTHHLADYLRLLDKDPDSVAAATQAFGDLKQLQSALQAYVRQMSFTYVQSPFVTNVEPENLGYRINTANVLMQMQRPDDAVRVLQNAMHLAKTPEETSMVENFILQASQYSQAEARGSGAYVEDEPDAEVTTTTAVEQADAEQINRDQPVPNGPHRTMTGLLTEVTCSRAAMDLELMAGGKRIPMHANNYFNVQYSVFEIDLKKDLNPCSDLDGRRAKVEYIEPQAQGGVAAIVAIELHK